MRKAYTGMMLNMAQESVVRVLAAERHAAALAAGLEAAKDDGVAALLRLKAIMDVRDVELHCFKLTVPSSEGTLVCMRHEGAHGGGALQTSSPQWHEETARRKGACGGPDGTCQDPRGIGPPARVRGASHHGDPQNGIQARRSSLQLPRGPVLPRSGRIPGRAAAEGGRIRSRRSGDDGVPVRLLLRLRRRQQGEGWQWRRSTCASVPSRREEPQGCCLEEDEATVEERALRLVPARRSSDSCEDIFAWWKCRSLDTFQCCCGPSNLALEGTMCYMSGNMQMDNNYLPENDGGVWQWIFGKSISSTIFFNTGSDDGYVGIAAPFPGRILPVDLANFNVELLCHRYLLSGDLDRAEIKCLFNKGTNDLDHMQMTESEMESMFKPGSVFGFNVILQLEKSDPDEGSEEQSNSVKEFIGAI